MGLFLAGTSPLAIGSIELILPGSLSGELTSEARDVSKDGRVVVGVSGNRLFKWEDGTLKDIGYVDRSGLRTGGSTDVNVSADGSTILASAPGQHSGMYLREADNWRTLINQPRSYSATSLSGDGRVVSFRKQGKAYVWQDGKYERLPVPSEFHSTQANAISDDGRIAVGYVLDWYRNFSYIENRILLTEACVWYDGQISSLKFLPGRESSLATSVSGNGAVIVGNSYYPTFDLDRVQYTAFRWKNNQMHALPPPIGRKTYSSAADVNGDGTIVVGRFGLADPPVLKSNQGYEPYDAESRACLWAASTDWNPVDLNEFLDANGVNRNGFVLDQAKAISADGTTIVGSGVTGAGRREAFIIKMSGAIPTRRMKATIASR